MRPTQIFIDLDDVLNYCTMAALQRVGCHVGPRSLHLFDPKWGFDIVVAANGLHPYLTFTKATFWDAIGKNFWAKALKSEECDWLIETCGDLVGRENVCILTAPLVDPVPDRAITDCLTGKLEWIHANLPSWLHKNYLMGPCKHLCAHPGALLIDDSDANVEAFRKRGGQAMLVPRPWNSEWKLWHNDMFAPVFWNSFLKNRLSDIFQV